MSWLNNSGFPMPGEVSENCGPASGRIVVFTLPKELTTAASILARLDGNDWSGQEALAERELKRRINEHVKTLPYPPSAVILPGARPDEHCYCLLTVCTILSKSSDRVYLSAKSPNLGYLTPGRTVRMFIPDGWRPMR